MSIFAMITTKHSGDYTPYAVGSFFTHTPFSPVDRFFLIDNDRSGVTGLPASVNVIENPQPLSFAANVNQMLRVATEESADLFFLNNDLIFTEGWLNPLAAQLPALLSPLSNREVQYETEGFTWKNALSLTDYIGRERELQNLARFHRTRMQGYKSVISLPFFCIKIPHSVYSKVGELDESFGRGGAEDNDYCLRACLAGFTVQYALSSYVLHFSGKSTWSGAESQSETAERCQRFRSFFEQKWGAELVKLYIDQDMTPLEADPALLELAKKEDFRSLLERMIARGK
ncbi:MAG: hypothetical protein U0136_09630 [Bdellovibrionota bacterium]